MAIRDALIAELKHESELTKKMLLKVPMEQHDWRPHAKSMTIGRLATHIAETVHWAGEIAANDEFNFAGAVFSGGTAANQEELISILQNNLDTATKLLSSMDDDALNKLWVVKRGEQLIFTLPKKAAIHSWSINHQIHHRGQLSVFLRLLDIPVPGMYGPSADEK
jgi:uncharacterized damage-inducible protein DinB